MARSFSLSIPKPCHERWETFTQTEKGGFCASCQKEVIDFTQWSDKQIREYIRQNNRGACGRFTPAQLKTYPGEHTPKSSWLTAPALALPLLLAANQLQAQDTKTIHGRVLSSEDSIAIPGASITLKGTTQRTSTDAEGRFTIDVNTNNRDETLVASSLGFKIQEIRVSKVSDKEIKVYMTNDVTGLFEVVTVERNGLRGFWDRVKRIF